MHILVGGGAGYIGSHMCKMLAEHGHDVTVFDNLSTGHRAALRWGRFVQGDLLAPADLERAFSGERIDTVMHFCARSIVSESVAKPDLYYQNNVVGSQNLLQAMLKHDVRNFIFSSTAAVYGVPNYTPIDEAHPQKPINPYGETKARVEEILLAHDRDHGLRSVSLRYFNAAGADPSGTIGEQHDPETHLIPNVLLSLLSGNGKPLSVFGNDYDTPDGTCVRDYVHVNDLCDAHLKSLAYLTKGGSSDVFNLGNGQGFSVLNIVSAAEAVTGKKIHYQITDRRPGDPPVLIASSAKARERLSWQPAYTEPQSIIESAWRWHKKHI
jgi:UDP-glucose 4-epimerase